MYVATSVGLYIMFECIILIATDLLKKIKKNKKYEMDIDWNKVGKKLFWARFYVYT